MNGLDFMQSVCEKITPLVEPLSQHFKLNMIGYRKFFSDGTCFNTSSNFEWTKFIHEKFSNTMLPNYENELSSALKEGKRYFLRIGEPDPQDVHLSTLYERDVWNTLSIYKKDIDSIDVFYFASTRENYKIINRYFNDLQLFEKFSHYFKDKIYDIISPEEMKKASSLTISPKFFEEYSIKAIPD